MKRQAKEIMSVVNIGATANNGELIPVGTPTRMVFGVMNNNPCWTALSDDEIMKMSHHNENAIVPGRAESEWNYRIVFHGEFSIENICYAIIRPCMCTVDRNECETTIMTGMFSAMNTITRLINRVVKDNVTNFDIYRIEKNGIIYRLDGASQVDDIISTISLDKSRRARGETDGMLVNDYNTAANSGAYVTPVLEKEMSSNPIEEDSSFANKSVKESEIDVTNTAGEDTSLLEKIKKLEAEVKCIQLENESIRNINSKLMYENEQLKNEMVRDEQGYKELEEKLRKSEKMLQMVREIVG